MKNYISVSLYHDTFKWRQFDTPQLQVTCGNFTVDILDLKTSNNDLLVGMVYYGTDLLDPLRPYGVMHKASNSILTTWHSRYYAEVYADTISQSRDWSKRKIDFKTVEDCEIFRLSQKIVHEVLTRGGRPLDPSYKTMSGSVN